MTDADHRFSWAPERDAELAPDLGNHGLSDVVERGGQWFLGEETVQDLGVDLRALRASPHQPEGLGAVLGEDRTPGQLETYIRTVRVAQSVRDGAPGNVSLGCFGRHRREQADVVGMQKVDAIAPHDL